MPLNTGTRYKVRRKAPGPSKLTLQADATIDDKGLRSGVSHSDSKLESTGRKHKKPIPHLTRRRNPK